MKFRILTLFLVLLALGAATQPAKLVRPGQQIQWSMGDARKIYRLGDLTATFDRVQCAPLGEDCEEEQLEPKVTVATADGKSITLDGSSMQNILMLGPIAKGGPIVAFLQSYSGGMHCCQELRVILRDATGLKVVQLGAYDGAEIAWPRDIDGDGNLDFVVTDDRFLYAFESYAGSWTPPLVLNVIDGKVVDLSTDPRFRTVFEKAAAQTRKACEREKYPNGACAAYAANAARLGQLEAAWPTILARHQKDLRTWPDSCKVARVGEDQGCPEGQLIEYPDYPTALKAYLKELGYTA